MGLFVSTHVHLPMAGEGGDAVGGARAGVLRELHPRRGGSRGVDHQIEGPDGGVSGVSSRMRRTVESVRSRVEPPAP